jgi:hypothetical protein
MHPVAKLLPFSALCLGLGLGIAWFSARPENADADASAPSPTEAPSPSPAPRAVPAYAAQPDAEARGPEAATHAPAETGDALAPDDAEAAASAGLPPEQRARLIAEIEAAYTTYHPDALPVLARFLAHPDREIRTFARDAIVQVGHADGATLLRGAARESRDPRESVALLDAAEFLELPPAPPVTGTFTQRASSLKRRDTPLRRVAADTTP